MKVQDQVQCRPPRKTKARRSPTVLTHLKKFQQAEVALRITTSGRAIKFSQQTKKAKSSQKAQKSTTKISSPCLRARVSLCLTAKRTFRPQRRLIKRSQCPNKDQSYQLMSRRKTSKQWLTSANTAIWQLLTPSPPLWKNGHSSVT